MRISLFLCCYFFIGIMLGQEISVMTYNIRLDVASDGENSWSNRKVDVVSQLKFYEPDIFGTQEGLPHQIKYIDDELQHYNVIGEGREGKTNGEYSAIFYNSKKFEVITQATFWLSPTPDKVSKGWDAAYIRICTYGLFMDKSSKKKFWMFNTHLDNQGEEARNNGINLITSKINEVNTENLPVIVTGDFNDTPDSKLIAGLKNKMIDTRSLSQESPFGPIGTFNGFKFHEMVNDRIDYIFISKTPKINILKYAVLTDSKDLKYPSDHFPVFVKLKVE